MQAKDVAAIVTEVLRASRGDAIREAVDEINRKTCAHFPCNRWQYKGHWMCCTCGRYFHGDKRQTPLYDINGRAA